MIQGNKHTRMYLDIAAQGFSPYQYKSGGITAEAPLAALSFSERNVKLQLWINHLHNPCDGIYALCKTVDDMAEACSQPIIRKEMNEMFNIPANAPALFKLIQLTYSTDNTVTLSSVHALHNLLWPSSPEYLPTCTTILMLNRLVDARERPLNVITQMLGGLVGLLSSSSDQGRKEAACLLRFLLCIKYDSWNKLHLEVVASLVLTFGQLVQSQALDVFVEGCRAASWLVESNPQTVHRIGYCSNLPPSVFTRLMECMIKALWHFEPTGTGPGTADNSAIWEMLLYIAKLPKGRMNLLAENMAYENTGFARSAGADNDYLSAADCTQELLTCLTECLLKPASARRALITLKALVADTSDQAGANCATVILKRSVDPGFMLLSLSIALKDLATEHACMPPFARHDAGDTNPNNPHGRYSPEIALDCGKHAMLKLLGANMYEDLKRWVSGFGTRAVDEVESRAAASMVCGAVVVLHDAAKLYCQPKGAVQVPAGSALPLQDQEGNALKGVTHWLLAVALDFLHALAGCVPPHMLLAALGENLQEAIRGLAPVVSVDEPILALKAIQVLGVLAKAEKGPLLAMEMVDSLICVLSARMVRLPTADPNTEHLMVSAVDTLHSIFDRESGQDLLGSMLGGWGAAQAEGTGWRSWFTGTGGGGGHRDGAAKQDLNAGLAAESFLTGVSHAMSLEDLSLASKALELLVRSLMHPCGEGFKLYLQLGDVTHWLRRVNMFLQTWPYTTKVGNKTFSEYRDAMQRNALMVMLAFIEHKDGRDVLDAMDQDVMIVMVKALRLLENKVAAGTAHLKPPTREIASRIIHSLSYECSPKWLVAVQREATPVTSLFANLFST